MAKQHVYMSTTALKRDIATGQFLVPENTKMNYRGEVGPGDDPDGFRARMAALGHLVVIVGKRPKNEQPAPAKRPGRPQQPPFCFAKDLAS